MQLEYSLTEADLHEAAQSLTPAVSRRHLMWDTAGMFIWFLLSVYYALPRIFWFNRDLPKGPDEERNLWVTLAPSLSMASYFRISAFINPKLVRLRQTQGPGRKQAREYMFALQMLQFLAFLWIIPAVWSPLTIRWNPTDGQILWAAFCPWLFYLIVARILHARRQTSAVAEEWKRNDALRRSSVVNIDASGVHADDGVVEHRIRWAGFKRYRETEHLLLLQTESSAQFQIPKRAIRDSQDMDAIKMLIHNNITEGSFKPQSSAFPVVIPAK